MLKFLNCLTFALIFVAAAQAQGVISPNSFRLDTLRKAIESRQSNPPNREYLRRFPKTCWDFKRIFYGSNLDELSPAYEQHMALLQRLYSKYPQTVVSIWFGIATNCAWDADALSEVQDQLARYGSRQTKAFAETLNSIPRVKRQSIIRFLADVENHRAYPSYKIIQINLKKTGYRRLEKEFEQAKANRMAQ